jgi:hypothetical protein
LQVVVKRPARRSQLGVDPQHVEGWDGDGAGAICALHGERAEVVDLIGGAMLRAEPEVLAQVARRDGKERRG